MKETEVIARLRSGAEICCRRHYAAQAIFWCEACGDLGCADCIPAGSCPNCGRVVRSLGAILLRLKEAASQ